jgi:beta-glucosidase-like glycosyl hydrolase
VNLDLERLDRIELVPFRAAIRAGVDSIMTAHVIYDALDSQLPATLSVKVVHDILRNKLLFNKLIFTDDLCMKAVSDNWPIPEAAALSLNAGADILIIAKEAAFDRKLLDTIQKNVHRDKLYSSSLRFKEVLPRYI